MTKILLLHGWGGKKEGHWLTWLERELISRDTEVFYPKIPNNYNPNLQKWLVHLDDFVKEFQPTVVVAHSLGALLWWHYEHLHGYKLHTLICVAPPTFSSFDSKMHTFFPLPKAQVSQCKHHIIYAKDDKNINASTLKETALSYKAQLTIKQTGEHLDHFSQTTELLEILTLLDI